MDAAQYEAWLSAHGGLVSWREESVNGNRRHLIIEAETGLIELRTELQSNKTRIHSPRFIEFSDVGSTRAGAFDAALRRVRDPHRITSIYPVVDGKKIRWNFDITEKKGELATELKSFEVTPGAAVLFRYGQVLTAPASVLTTTPETLASNDLHHPDRYVAEAEELTRNATSIKDKAEIIYRHVRKTIKFSTGNKEVRNLTFADTLVSSLKKGACDEFAVLLVSYLRALKIHSQIRFLTSSNTESHAFVEYQDENAAWQHMDAVFNAHPNPLVYTVYKGMVNVCVLVAEQPDDERAAQDSFCTHDPDGDGKLNPYCDFILVPMLPGEKYLQYSDSTAVCP